MPMYCFTVHKRMYWPNLGCVRIYVLNTWNTQGPQSTSVTPLIFIYVCITLLNQVYRVMSKTEYKLPPSPKDEYVISHHDECPRWGYTKLSCMASQLIRFELQNESFTGKATMALFLYYMFNRYCMECAWALYTPAETVAKKAYILTSSTTGNTI